MKKNKNIPITNEEKHLHDLHIAEKFAMQKEKNTGKLKDETILFQCFIWKQNVITLSKAGPGSFFYKKSQLSII